MGTLRRLAWMLASLLPGAALAMETSTPSVLSARPVGLHLLVLQVATVLAVIALLIVAWAVIILLRERATALPAATAARADTWSWLLVPLLVLIATVALAGHGLQAMVAWRSGAAAPPLEVKVTAHQGWWEYQYPVSGVRLESRPEGPCACDADHPLVLPVGRAVRVLSTSADVPHPFVVTELGLHHDAIPGYVREAWAMPEREGVFRGECASACGSRSGMPVVVRVLGAVEFDAWLSRQAVSGAAVPRSMRQERRQTGATARE